MSRGLLKTKLLAKSSNTTPTTSSQYQVITLANLQTLINSGSLVAGRYYQITNLDSNLPDWQGVFMADSGTKLSTQGQGIYQNTLFTEAWVDWSTFSFVKIYDPKYNNEVENNINITLFKWNNPSWSDNKILGSQAVQADSVTVFTNNLIRNSQLDIIGNTVAAFEYNEIVNCPNIVVTPSVAGYTYKNNYIANSSINFIQQGQLDSCSVENIGANIAESHTKETVFGGRYSTFSVTLSFNANYNAGTSTLTIPINYKAYVGIFNFTNVGTGTGAINAVTTIVNPPIEWDYSIYNKSNNTDTLRLTKNTGNLRFGQGVSGSHIDLVNPPEYAQFKDYSNIEYLIIHNDY